MGGLIIPFFLPVISRPPKGEAGIAGNPGIPVSGHFGNRGKITIPTGITVFKPCRLFLE